MNFCKNGSVLVLVMMLLATSVTAGSFYVTSADEIETAMSMARPGDTVLMANGLWTDERIVFEGNGKEGNPIVLRAETPGSVVLNGYSTLRIAGTYLEVDGLRFIGGRSISGAVIEFRNGSRNLSHHCRLTNTSIVDYNPSSRSNDYKWVSVYGQYNRVDHCYFSGKTNGGTTLVVWFERSSSPPAHYHRIDHNYFGHRPALGVNGGETIRIGTSTYSLYNSRTVVEHNYFEHCNGEIEIISNKSCENIYRYNTFYECEGALTLRHGNRCTVEKNFFIGNRLDLTGGVRVIGEDHKIINNYFQGLYGSSFKSALPILNGVPDSPLNRYFQVKNALVAFNTFVDCRYSMIIGAGNDSERTLPPENCTIANNVIMTTYTAIRREDEPINLTWEGNIVQSPDLGISRPDGITLADVDLSEALDGLWRPSETSPLLNAAQGDYPEIIHDMDNQPRDVQKDVGADEFSQEPISNRPLTSQDAGPDWLGMPVPLLLKITASEGGNVHYEPSQVIFEGGTQVTAVAIPDSGYKFVEWQGDINSDEDTLRFTMNEITVLKAVFALDVPPRYKLAVYVFSSGGTVAYDPQAETYEDSTMVTITAIPDSGWQFVEWQGDLESKTNPEQVLMDSDKFVLAVFERLTDVSILADRPYEYRLEQNYPNPFNASTTITFSLKQSQPTTLQIFDILGRKVIDLVDETLNAGRYEVRFDASGLESGIYFYNLQAGPFQAAGKMTLTK
ncbi:T9SS type A sorting domain-containing protein [candidate division KSB1 bacterium]|nr:T9SS type A sorting domain-containing protein [candidate division KSB1 bacterium]